MRVGLPVSFELNRFYSIYQLHHWQKDGNANARQLIDRLAQEKSWDLKKISVWEKMNRADVVNAGVR